MKKCKKKKTYRFHSFCLALCMVLGMIPPAFAAELPANARGFVTAVNDSDSKRLFVFQNNDLSIWKNEWIDAKSDEVTFHFDSIDLTHMSILVSYHTYRGEVKSRYVPLVAAFATNSVDDMQTAICIAKTPTFKTRALSTSYGYADVTDVVYLWKTGTVYRIIYPLAGGGYKMAFISAHDAQNNFQVISTNSSIDPTEDAILQRLNEMMNGTYGNAAYTLNTTYRGRYWTEECKGFAKSIFQDNFGYNIGSTVAKPNNYKLNVDSNRTLLVGSLTNLGQQSNASIQTLFSTSKAGDFIQLRRSHGGSHSVIFLSSDAATVTVLECNVDGRNTIQKNTYDWETFRSKNTAVSVYSAKEYYLH